MTGDANELQKWCREKKLIRSQVTIRVMLLKQDEAFVDRGFLVLVGSRVRAVCVARVTVAEAHKAIVRTIDSKRIFHVVQGEFFGSYINEF